MRSFHAMFVVAATTAGCQVEDADLANGALSSFTLTPAATTTDRFSMDYTGTVTSGFTSERPATLLVKVDGQPVVQQAVDLSNQLSQPLQISVPLAVEGPNAVSAELEYQGATLSQDSVITVMMAAPTITIPTFTQTYTAHVGLRATGKVQVAAAAGYAVEEVATSTDDGPWQPATSDGIGGWDVVIADPDIGDVNVAVRAEVSIDGHATAAISHSTMHVNPIFNCGAASSMLPTTTLIRQNSNENRVMVGYFGPPGQGHDVSFILTGNASDFPGSPLVTVVSETVAYGTVEIHAAFHTDPLRCVNNPCDTNYNLSAMVDGVVLCSTTGGAGGSFFGIVRDF
ncbi:MAG: hypothetical protein H6Q90_7254 [Deltaproteobacteria bacterium]|nr:hypothetical protein [Deltaproteobacteria bacterium]